MKWPVGEAPACVAQLIVGTATAAAARAPAAAVHPRRRCPPGLIRCMSTPVLVHEPLLVGSVTVDVGPVVEDAPRSRTGPPPLG